MSVCNLSNADIRNAVVDAIYDIIDFNEEVGNFLPLVKDYLGNVNLPDSENAETDNLSINIYSTIQDKARFLKDENLKTKLLSISLQDIYITLYNDNIDVSRIIEGSCNYE